MRGIMTLAALAALAAPSASLAAAAARDYEADLAKLVAGRTAGKPVTCITLTPTRDSTTIPRTAIVYRDGDTLYVNRFDRGCPELDQDTFLITRTPSTQLCRGDIAEIRETTPAIPRGSCVMGDFTPYVKAGR